MGIDLRSVAMSAWPRSCWTERSSAPFCSRWLAKACRRRRGDTLAAESPPRRRPPSVRARHAGALDDRSPRMRERSHFERAEARFLAQRQIGGNGLPAAPFSGTMRSLFALGAHDEKTLVAAERRRWERDQFRHAHAGRVEEFQKAGQTRALSSFPDGRSGSAMPSREVASTGRSTSDRSSVFGRGRPRFGPSSTAAGSPRSCLRHRGSGGVGARRRADGRGRRSSAPVTGNRPGRRGSRPWRPIVVVRPPQRRIPRSPRGRGDRPRACCARRRAPPPSCRGRGRPRRPRGRLAPRLEARGRAPRRSSRVAPVPRDRRAPACRRSRDLPARAGSPQSGTGLAPGSPRRIALFDHQSLFVARRKRTAAGCNRGQQLSGAFRRLPAASMVAPPRGPA